MNSYIDKVLEIANHSKYTKWYCNIVLNAIIRTEVKGLVERHHILPKSFKLGGEKDKKNIVNLTLKEHFICHHLLTKMFEGELKKKMVFAFWRMVNQKIINKSSREYCEAKSLHYLIQINSKRSQETKNKLSLVHKGKKKNYEVWNKGKKGLVVHSQETRDIISKSARSVSLETRRKIGEASSLRLKGRTHKEIYGDKSEEIKEKIRNKLKSKCKQLN